MNPTAIYSKSGKGVQEAAGKTSLLKRGDRAALSAIDGRATLADVAQKVGKSFDKDFQQLITQLDKDGFIREVSAGAAPAGAKPAAKPAPKPAAPTAPMDAASDLDFSSIAPAPRPAAPPPKAAAAVPAKEQQSALNKAREEAEAKAAAEREKQKAEAEANVRAELEAKMRAEAEEKAKEAAANKGKADAAARLQAEADAKIKAARDAAVRAAAEAKGRADAETKRVREAAEAKAEQARREADEMKKRLDAERKAREEAERRAKEEAERARKQLEEERRQLEEERKRHEEEERKKEEERAERRRREEEEEQARRRQREEEERKAEEEREARRRQREEEDRKAEEEREARRKQREEEQRLADEEERRQEEERAARRKQEQEERRRREEAETEAEEQARAAQNKPKAEAKPAAKAAESGASFSDTLLSDLDSFGKKDDEERKEKEEAERKSKDDAKRRAREEAERKEREEEEERRREAEERKRKRREEEEAREREEEEEKERKRKEKEEARRKEDEEAKREEEEKKRKKARKKDDDDIPITDADLGGDDVRRDQRELARAAKASPRPKESARVKLPPPVTGPSVRRKPVSWGKPVSVVLFLLFAGGVGVAHLMPIDTKPYADAASEAFGRPVRIGSGRLWLFNGNLQLKLQDVTVGDAKIAGVSAFPAFGSLSEPKKVFSRIEIEGLSLSQEAAGSALFARAKSDNFSVDKVLLKQLQLTGPLVLPKSVDAEIVLNANGAPSAVTLRGPDGLVARLTPKESAIDVEVTAGGFTLPVAPEVSFSSFGLKGSATRDGLQIEKWDGTLLNGNITGTANVRWGATWSVDGVFTMRGINAAVFAPALLSEGRGEGTAKFNLSGADPAKLGAGGRFEGNFTVNTGVLGSVDLNQALATGGKRASGRTPFTEMTGQAVYQAGALALRNVTISAGSAGNMNAGASVDVAPSGALSGRIVADVRTPNQTLRATLNLGGTVKDPQVRN